MTAKLPNRKSEFQQRVQAFINTQAPELLRAPAEDEIDPRLVKLTRWLDDAIPIPGTSIRIGLDGIFGLLPVVGDLPGALFTLWLQQEAKRLGLPRIKRMQMVMNSLIDFLVGSIPLAGDLFDFAFKANRKNLTILEKHVAKQKKKRPPTTGTEYPMESQDFHGGSDRT